MFGSEKNTIILARSRLCVYVCVEVVRTSVLSLTTQRGKQPSCREPYTQTHTDAHAHTHKDRVQHFRDPVW